MSPSPVNDTSCVSHPISSTSSFDATVVPVPPPPRPPRPVKVPGYLLTAPTQADAQRWLEQRVFYTQDRAILQSIRQKQPIFLLDAQAQRLHGVFQRVQDMLQQDLTSPAGQHGYQVHVAPLYEFAVTLKLDTVDDLLVPQQQSLLHKQQQQQGHHGSSNTHSSSTFEPMLGSLQHGALWEAFMKAAKKQHQAMESIQEEEQQQQQQQQQQGGMPPPPAASAAAAVAAANGHHT